MTKLLAVAALVVSQTFAGAAFASPVTKEIAINLHDVFVPEKVEQGAEAKVVVSGMFPNSCYSWSRANVVDADSTTHMVQVFARVTETMCLMVLVPYSKEVNFGRLQRGQHTLRFINGDETYFERTLNVE